MKLKKFSAALAGLSLLWGTAFAQSEPVQTPDAPIIILELQPGQLQPTDPAGGQSEVNEQAMLGMLLMQLLSALQAEGDNAEIQLIVPAADSGVGI